MTNELNILRSTMEAMTRAGILEVINAPADERNLRRRTTR
jgi:hypothetical protein